MFQTKHGESKLNKMYKPPWRFRGETITAGKARATDNWGRIRKKKYSVEKVSFDASIYAV